jgi:hypothetical protein
LGEEVRSVNKASKWRWTCAELGLSGLSREPLLDACRAVKRMGDQNQHRQIGLYRPGRDWSDLFCSVEVGTGLTVKENEKIGPVLVKWAPRDFGTSADTNPQG